MKLALKIMILFGIIVGLSSVILFQPLVIEAEAASSQVDISSISCPNTVYRGDINNLIDGNREGYHALFVASDDELVWITLDLGATYSIDQIIISARRNKANYYYQIQASINGETWNQIVVEGLYDYFDYDYEPFWQLMDFNTEATNPYDIDEFNAQYIRIGIKDYPSMWYYPGYIYEIEIYGDCSNRIDLGTPTADEPLHSGALENLVDGNREGSHAIFRTYDYNVWINFDLGSQYTINEIIISASRNRANRYYQIESSFDGTAWNEVKPLGEYDYSSYYGSRQILDFSTESSDPYDIEEFQASHIRIKIAGQSGYYPGYVYEVEIYGDDNRIDLGTPTADESLHSGALENLVDGNREGSHAIFRATDYNVWITFDLGGQYTINEIIISASRNRANRYYQIESSLDGTAWNEVKPLGEYDYSSYYGSRQLLDFSTESSDPYDIEEFQASHIRIKIAGPGYYPGYVYEVEIYGVL